MRKRVKLAVIGLPVIAAAAAILSMTVVSSAGSAVTAGGAHKLAPGAAAGPAVTRPPVVRRDHRAYDHRRHEGLRACDRLDPRDGVLRRGHPRVRLLGQRYGRRHGQDTSPLSASC